MPDTNRAVLQGTVDLLVLKTLSWGPRHGYAIARWIEETTDDALRIEEGSLYPALRRMQVKGWVASERKRTPTGRDARYYRLTAAGRRQLAEEEEVFKQSVAVTARVLRGSES